MNVPPAPMVKPPLLGRDVFNREFVDPVSNTQMPSTLLIDAQELFKVMRDIIERQQPEMFLEIKSEPVSLKDKIQDILVRLQKHPWLSFRSLFSDDFSRSNVVVTFLALLELVKIGAARIYQETPFGSIVISRR